MEIGRLLPTLGIVGGILALAGFVVPIFLPNTDWLTTLCESLALLCFFTLFIVQFQRIKSFSQQRATRLGLNSIIAVILVGAIVVIMNFLAARHAPEWDFSETQHFTLSRQTYQILRKLEQPIAIKVFAHERSPKYASFHDLLTTYSKETKKITVEYIDPERQPELAKKYAITQIDTAVVESPSQKIYLKEASENEVTNALLRVTQSTKKGLVFLTGHGEKGLSDQQSSGLSRAKDALNKQGYDIDTIPKMSEDRETDPAVIILASPQESLTEKEVTHLQHYLASGGHLLLLVDPQNKDSVQSLTHQWGVTLGKGIVVDEQHRLGRGSPTALQIRTFTGHDITDEFTVPILLPVSRHIDFDIEKGKDWDFVSLAQTSEKSWAEVNLTNTEPELNPEEDLEGPLTIAAALTAKTSSQGAQGFGKVVIIGNSAFATNGYITYPGNTDFFLKTVAWLADEGHLVSIAPKEPAFRPFVPNPSQEQALLFFQVLFLPLFTLFLGFSIWKKRRRL
ncbi:MAG: GldG family protein [Nitrospirales bacterium]